MTKKIDRISEIPANPNSIENGFDDPQPEKGKEGSGWRAWWSWVKGWGSESGKGDGNHEGKSE